jgi:hypothetical protein
MQQFLGESDLLNDYKSDANQTHPYLAARGRRACCARVRLAGRRLLFVFPVTQFTVA